VANRRLFDLFGLGAPARPLPLTLAIECGGARVEVAVTVRDNARRMILRLDRRSRLPTLTLPRGVSRAKAERFLADHIGWLESRLRAAPAPLPFVDGAVIPIRGEPCRIAHRAPLRGLTRIEPGEAGPLLVVHGDPAQLPGRVERFLRGEAERDLRAAVARHAAAAGVDYGRIAIKDTLSRWGSCSAKGDLAFSWRLILAPPAILDYLAAHEIAHRLEMNHSARYWRHVARLFPEFRAAEAWLNRHGQSLHLYGRD
jgi:hypothetical protein